MKSKLDSFKTLSLPLLVEFNHAIMHSIFSYLIQKALVPQIATKSTTLYNNTQYCKNILNLLELSYLTQNSQLFYFRKLFAFPSLKSFIQFSFNIQHSFHLSQHFIITIHNVYCSTFSSPLHRLNQ